MIHFCLFDCCEAVSQFSDTFLNVSANLLLKVDFSHLSRRSDQTSRKVYCATKAFSDASLLSFHICLVIIMASRFSPVLSSCSACYMISYSSLSFSQSDICGKRRLLAPINFFRISQNSNFTSCNLEFQWQFRFLFVTSIQIQDSQFNSEVRTALVRSKLAQCIAFLQ